ncbi:hypothetical protein GTA08_BOTSDO05047 [Botryosphaeria dothidea]|uniref:Uncharacterized protein n=1 Tax=Botryosphaeria dothidea TaxID=55169 RepID=A0A8H4ISG4_9PEZI|nr:hypothetical protein GTA08_BOTSDO05047 [Botryosphaeria dothidea]
MDFNSILHAHNKIMADRATSDTTVRSNNTAANQPNQDTPPPAYSSLTSQHPHLRPGEITNMADLGNFYASEVSDTDSEASDNSDSDSDHQTLSIDAATVIHGSNNVIAIPPVDGPRLTAILLSLLHGNLPTQQQQQQQQHLRPGTAPPAFHHHVPGHLPDDGRRPLSVRINCGVRIVGDKNVLGALPPQRVEGSRATSAAMASARHNSQSGPTATATAGLVTPPETPLGENGGTRKRKADGEVASREDAKRGKAEGADRD